MDGEMSDQTMEDLETLGVTEEESGMNMDMHELHGAKPFDRTFTDMMIPHHQGVIRMARAELAEGENRRLRKIARAIVRDQEKEIRTMNKWRKAWYGAPSPAGGVPTLLQRSACDTSWAGPAAGSSVPQCASARRFQRPTMGRSSSVASRPRARRGRLDAIRHRVGAAPTRSFTQRGGGSMRRPVVFAIVPPVFGPNGGANRRLDLGRGSL